VLVAAALLATASAAACSASGAGGSGVTYYISPAGSDSAAGTSPTTAWRTLGRANSANLRPGDRVLLQGGAHFSGPLALGPNDAGNPGRPVRIGSYGMGKATIVGVSGPGISVFDTAGIDIRDVRLVGGTGATSGPAGIQVYSDLAAGRRLSHILIGGVDASGFTTGIDIGARHPAAGFRNVWITNCALHDNVDAGLSFFGPQFEPSAPSYAHADVHISRVRAFRNFGDPANTRHNTGSGIVLGGVIHGDVALSTAHNNGGAGGSTNEGPIGIWAYDSRDVVIENSLSYGNRTASRHDGGGFGLDRSVSNSYLQYNLSYGNAGAGYQVYSPSQSGNAANIVRFNIGSGDARHSAGAAGIVVGGRVKDASIYQNTIVMSAVSGAARAALSLGAVRGVTVRNNIFVVQGPGPVVVAEPTASRAVALLQGNDYFAHAGWSIRWGSKSYLSLRAWRRGTGQELVRGRSAGHELPPRMTGPVLGLTAASPSPGNGAGFILRRGSALLGAGLDLVRLFGLDPGPRNFSGMAISRHAPNVGAQ